MATEVGVGFSQHASPLEVGRGATQPVLERRVGQEPDLVMLFSTIDQKQARCWRGCAPWIENARLCEQVR